MVLAAQCEPPAIKVRSFGSAIAAADSRAVLRLPTSRKVSVAVLKICELALDTVEVARLMAPPSLPPVSPPAIRILPASAPGVAVAVGPPVLVAVAVAVEVAVGVPVAVAGAVGVDVAVLGGGT